MHPLRARQEVVRWPGYGRLYCHVTLGFTLGLYLPWATAAPDLARHFGEAVHSWAIVFLAPLAAWRLAGRAIGPRRHRRKPIRHHLPAGSSTGQRAMTGGRPATANQRPPFDLHEKPLSRSFYATQPAACPYLPGRIEQRIVTPFFAGDEAGFFDSLNQAGFRRSHGFLYRPACPGCQACIPVRVPVDRFAWTRRFRKVWNRNCDLTAERCPARATDEQYALFKRYLEARHDDGGMARMNREDYRELVENAPADTFVVEFRRAGELVAVALSDALLSGLSGVYKFFAPELEKRSLGTFVILWHLQEAAREGLPFVYLGYWIEQSRKMRYKASFQPMEQLGPGGWIPLPPLSTPFLDVRGHHSTTG